MSWRPHALLATIATVALLSAGCSGPSASRPTPPATSTATRAATPSAGCPDDIHRGPLPVWARDGFSPPDESVPYVLGERGRILGVVFGDPLQAPARGGRANKILWVASPAPTGVSVATSGALHIHGSLPGSDATFDQVVAGGPGPSIVDVPRPGCWTLDLRWSGRTDRVTLRYR